MNPAEAGIQRISTDKGQGRCHPRRSREAQPHAIVPDRSNRRVEIKNDRELYNQHGHIDRLFGRPKIKRIDSACHGQCAKSFLYAPHSDSRIPT